MYCNKVFKTVEIREQPPVVISNSAVVELELPVAPASQQEGFVIVNLEGCLSPYQDEPDKELLLK